MSCEVTNWHDSVDNTLKAFQWTGGGRGLQWPHPDRWQQECSPGVPCHQGQDRDSGVCHGGQEGLARGDEWHHAYHEARDSEHVPILRGWTVLGLRLRGEYHPLRPHHGGRQEPQADAGCQVARAGSWELLP